MFTCHWMRETEKWRECGDNPDTLSSMLRTAYEPLLIHLHINVNRVRVWQCAYPHIGKINPREPSSATGMMNICTSIPSILQTHSITLCPRRSVVRPPEKSHLHTVCSIETWIGKRKCQSIAMALSLCWAYHIAEWTQLALFGFLDGWNVWYTFDVRTTQTLCDVCWYFKCLIRTNATESSSTSFNWPHKIE